MESVAEGGGTYNLLEYSGKQWVECETSGTNSFLDISNVKLRDSKIKHFWQIVGKKTYNQPLNAGQEQVKGKLIHEINMDIARFYVK